MGERYPLAPVLERPGVTGSGAGYGGPVQTFLPYPGFAATAAVLDDRRLGKQRVEVIQIVRAIFVPGYGWANHPATLMWLPHAEALECYVGAICDEWRARGFEDTCQATVRQDLAAAGVPGPVRSQEELAEAGLLPAWLGDDGLHRSHRSALLRKDPAHYRPLFPDDPDDLPYVWPVRSAGAIEAEERRAQAALARAARQARREVEEAEKTARRRRAAAQRGWRTRRARGAG